ncbi:MAG: hypothetical protein ACTSW4_04650 [Candidatus Ranarchaeia archaeon]
MPIVNGRYEVQLSTTFSSPEEGIEEIKRNIIKRRRIWVNSIPPKLLEEIKPLLHDKDVKIILPLDAQPTDDLFLLGDVATTKAKIYVNYKGVEAYSGSVIFSNTVYNLIWAEDTIYEVSTMEYGKCVKCLGSTFEGAWRYSKKWKQK